MMIEISDNLVYVLGDGDKIRERIEAALLQWEFEETSKVSENLKRAIELLSKTAREDMNAKVVIAGGDDIFFITEKDRYKLSYIEKLAALFFDLTGNTISFGIGITIEMAYINLRRAKAVRGSKIVYTGVYHE